MNIDVKTTQSLLELAQVVDERVTAHLADSLYEDYSKSGFIHEDAILERIYQDAVKKYMKEVSKRVCFMEICRYVRRKLWQKKQSVYENAIPIVKEVCQRTAEDFWNGVEHFAPDAKNHRDVFFAIYESL